VRNTEKVLGKTVLDTRGSSSVGMERESRVGNTSVKACRTEWTIPQVSVVYRIRFSINN